jgi:hypothetical protein
MPLDIAPTREGAIVLISVRDETARVLSGDELVRARNAGARLYTSHFATCREAERHRRKNPAVVAYRLAVMEALGNPDANTIEPPSLSPRSDEPEQRDLFGRRQ